MKGPVSPSLPPPCAPAGPARRLGRSWPSRSRAASGGGWGPGKSPGPPGGLLPSRADSSPRCNEQGLGAARHCPAPAERASPNLPRFPLCAIRDRPGAISRLLVGRCPTLNTALHSPFPTYRARTQAAARRVQPAPPPPPRAPRSDEHHPPHAD
ncbi:hypothetical protein F751_6297 [Auxenochlorella protothecoides]|uniref:Uncharacterized protein n=1 Tax=Auxenochlorella protothecoides TaxID=3075 RepID=A0A087SK92_AUXPR|nr:hypothetical protein F751_6297 [Auxenochlorella protothecoides]KFM26146.1 hypothetical protein F751_6297 [Auxenochlorella protothecoides]